MYQSEPTLLAMLLESQSRPSYNPSPEVAHVLWIYLWLTRDLKQNRQLAGQSRNKQTGKRLYQWRCRREWRPSLSVISAAFIAFGRSCLFANTSSTASLSSSYTYYKQQIIEHSNFTCITAKCIPHYWKFQLNRENKPTKCKEANRHTSFSIRWSSSLASTTRSRSLLSTTKISPWVFWK